ncbi:MAG: hypothetical protein FWD26_04125 [Treponema sp.]|nr:hypothetical protein [Treponema sp.]
MRKLIFAILAVFCLSPLFGADRAPINVNLIIDGSSSLGAVKTNVTDWVSGRLDQILAAGDRVTIWSAGSSARVIYSGTMNSQSDRDAAKRSIRDLSGSGTSADFSGALREAAALRSSAGFSYTLLISASPAALTSTLSGPQANLMRFSRIEEFSGWRAIVVGLNIDARVKSSAASFF